MLHTGAGWKSRIRMIYPDIWVPDADKENISSQTNAQNENRLIHGVPAKEYEIIKNPMKKFYYTTRKGNRYINYFAWWQTKELSMSLNPDGSIPKNAYDNFEAMNGIPDGTVHVPIKGIKAACKKMDIDWAEAVVDFDYSAGFPRPVLLGVIVHEENAIALINKHRELRK
jgi:xeroderma pigmentosum group C-complementing protein